MTVSPSLYHVGLVVPDLELGMHNLGEALGLTWAKVQKRQLRVWTPSGEIGSPIAVTYSIQGPPYWELFQQQADGPYAETGHHHVGIWADDLADQLRKLHEAGFAQEYAGLDETGALRGFRYLKDAEGNRVEVLDRAETLPMLERWLSGGDYR